MATSKCIDIASEKMSPKKKTFPTCFEMFVSKNSFDKKRKAKSKICIKFENNFPYKVIKEDKNSEKIQS